MERMQDDLYDGLAEEIAVGTRELLQRGMSPYDVLTKVLVAGMDIVGADFRDGVLFVPEVLMAAKAMKSGMAILRPLLAETGAPQVGTMVIGTVKGDIHDIGKNLVAMMMEGAGFKVVNLGINNDAAKFLEAVREHQPEPPGHERIADDDHALHGGGDQGPQRGRPARAVDRTRRRRTAERRLRRRDRGRCLLP